MHNIHDINQFVIRMYLYLKCSVKGCIHDQNAIFKVINQHKNDTSCAILGKGLLPWCPWFF
jgi:hypothetical protein